MPVEIVRLDNGQGLLVKGHAPLICKDKIETNETLLRSPNELAKLRYLLIDAENSEFQCSTPEIRTIAAQDKRIAKLAPLNLVVAVITPSHVDFGVGAQHRSKLCVRACSNSVLACARPPAAFASTLPPAGPFKSCSSQPLSPSTPAELNGSWELVSP